MKTKTHLLFVPVSTSVVQRILTSINVDLGWVGFRLSKTGMGGAEISASRSGSPVDG